MEGMEIKRSNELQVKIRRQFEGEISQLLMKSKKRKSVQYFS